MLKKIINILLLLLSLIVFSGFFIVNASDKFGGVDSVENVGVDGTSSAKTGGSEGFLTIVTGFINSVLAFLSFITLVILIYGGFLMVTAAGEEERYQQGFKIIKQSAIGLTLIALSWLIVSFIIYIVTNATGI